MRRMFVAIVGVGLVGASQTALAARDLYQELAEYFQQSLPEEAFIASPYGADSRFRPRTIWVYLDSAQNRGKSVFARKQSAWFVASSGLAVYGDDWVPLQHAPISLPTRDQDIGKKLALTASLGAKLLPKDVEAQLKIAREKNLAVDIVLPDAEIEYVYYEDLRMAEEGRPQALQRLLSATKKEGALPARRVISAAIRVRGARITVDADRKFDFGANADVKALVSSLGFFWNSTKGTFDLLEFADWRYIAYQALIADKNGRISVGADAGVDASREATSLPVENRSAP